MNPPTFNGGDNRRNWWNVAAGNEEIFAATQLLGQPRSKNYNIQLVGKILSMMGIIKKGEKN